MYVSELIKSKKSVELAGLLKRIIGVKSRYHLSTRQFNGRTPATETDTLCGHQGTQVWVVPVAIGVHRLRHSTVAGVAPGDRSRRDRGRVLHMRTTDSEAVVSTGVISVAQARDSSTYGSSLRNTCRMRPLHQATTKITNPRKMNRKS